MLGSGESKLYIFYDEILPSYFWVGAVDILGDGQAQECSGDEPVELHFEVWCISIGDYMPNVEVLYLLPSEEEG
jgi:hypothetical protein